MTINELQADLIAEIQQITKDMALIDAKGERSELKGYPQSVPVLPVFEAVPYTEQEENPEDKLFPYFVVRIDHIEYQKNGGDGSNLAHMILVFAIRDANPDMGGYFTLTAIMERVVMRFQTNPILGSFCCGHKMEMAFQEDDTFPQFFGGIEMTWNLPTLEMEEVI